MASSSVRWPDLSGDEALRRHAPQAAAALTRLVRAISAAPHQVALARYAAATAQELPPLPVPQGCVELPRAVLDGRWEQLPAADQVLLRFAEQFSVDVSAIDESQRTALCAALGQPLTRARGRFIAMTWVGDLVPRVRFVLDRLFAPSPTVAATSGELPVEDATDLGREFVRVVYNLHGLDDVVSEMIRLRGANAHNCRMCKSLRNRPALVAGASPDELAAAGAGERASLTPAQSAALALTDAIIWSPARIGEDVLDDVRRHFTPAQAVELVLDVMRNSWNKTTVAAVLDAANVDSGFEIYEYHDDGTLEFGLAPLGSPG